jgi:hypothetical protein
MNAFPFLMLLAVSVINAAEPPAPKALPNAATEKEKGEKKVTAVLLGKELTIAPGDELTGKITGALFKRYRDENKVVLTDADVDAYAKSRASQNMRMLEELKRDRAAAEEKLKSPTLADEERKKLERDVARHKEFVEDRDALELATKQDPKAAREMDRNVAEMFVLPWKLNQSLFQKYGGRVIFQQMGPEPVDAYRDYLKECEKKGDFKLLTDEAKEKFWKYFTDDKMHTFLDAESGREAMKTPWWLKDPKAER